MKKRKKNAGASEEPAAPAPERDGGAVPEEIAVANTVANEPADAESAFVPSGDPGSDPAGAWDATWDDATTRDSAEATTTAEPLAHPPDETAAAQIGSGDDPPGDGFDAPWVTAEGAEEAPAIDGDGPVAQGDAAAPGVAEGEAMADDVALPTEDARIESILESLLFAADRPLGVSDLKRLLGERDGKRISGALEAVRDRRIDSGIQLVSVAGGWQLRTHPANGAWVAKLVAGRPQRLSRAMMETLAIVAYRQPITRPEIDEIRGVDCGPVLRTLLDRGLVRIIGKKEEVGRPMLYGTTPEFLKTFSLGDLTELPTLREFHELGAEDRARVDAKAPEDTTGVRTDGPIDLPLSSELPVADPAEEDALMDELEQATQAAGRAGMAATTPAPAADEDAGAGAPEPSEG